MSLAEGLLTGNVNILKLPSADNGLCLGYAAYFYGEAHDGEYPLRRYTRVVDREL